MYLVGTRLTGLWEVLPLRTLFQSRSLRSPVHQKVPPRYHDPWSMGSRIQETIVWRTISVAITRCQISFFCPDWAKRKHNANYSAYIRSFFNHWRVKLFLMIIRNVDVVKRQVSTRVCLEGGTSKSPWAPSFSGFVISKFLFVTVFFSLIFFTPPGLEEGLYRKPKYRAILFEII